MRTELGILCLAVGAFVSSAVRGDMIDDVESLMDQDRASPAPMAKPAPSATPPGGAQGNKSKKAIRLPTPTPEPEPVDTMPQGSPPSRRVKQDGDPRKEPIHIKSDGQASYAKNGGLIHITQNVVISQSDLRFQADEAKVWVKEGDAEENIEKVECVGNVKVSKYSEDPAEKVTARGQKALFYNDQRKVVLQGDARLWRGGHLIKGAQITYNLDDGMITVDRAEGVVQPEEKKKGPKAVAKPAARGKEARP